MPGPGNQTVLIRNHEHRSREGETPVVVPPRTRCDPDPITRGGNTDLVVNGPREVVRSFAIRGGTHTNCAGGSTPWGTLITAEEILNYGSTGSEPGQGSPTVHLRDAGRLGGARCTRSRAAPPAASRTRRWRG